jgi:hypothetical protein
MVCAPPLLAHACKGTSSMHAKGQQGLPLVRYHCKHTLHAISYPCMLHVNTPAVQEGGANAASAMQLVDVFVQAGEAPEAVAAGGPAALSACVGSLQNSILQVTL